MAKNRLTPKEVEKIGNQWLAENNNDNGATYACPRGTYKKYAVASILLKDKSRKYMGMPRLLLITPKRECFKVGGLEALSLVGHITFY